MSKLQLEFLHWRPRKALVLSLISGCVALAMSTVALRDEDISIGDIEIVSLLASSIDLLAIRHRNYMIRVISSPELISPAWNQ